MGDLSTETGPKFLTPEELVDRFCVFSPGIVADLHSLTLQNLQTEDARESRLDAKASILLLASSLVLALVVVLGAILLRSRALDTFGRGALPFVVLYIATLLAGLLAAVGAVRVLLVSGEYRGIDECAVLNADELAAADKEFLEGQ